MKLAMDFLIQLSPRRESFYDVHGTVEQRRHCMTDFIICQTSPTIAFFALACCLALIFYFIPF